jgi:hypothetical protein
MNAGDVTKCIQPVAPFTECANGGLWILLKRGCLPGNIVPFLRPLRWLLAQRKGTQQQSGERKGTSAVLA